ncbi:Hypothetical protein HVR_LOCUS356 [uncultured virus]|nr:Hypothetical protein HVR_LOCUS356 [uncultured virus]
MALLGVKIPTVIVNAFDIMWYDVDIGVDDLDPFFFKNDPFIYLSNLRNEGWTVHLYAAPVTDELKRSILYQRNPEQYLKNKLVNLTVMFEEFNFLPETELPGIIANANSASFVIVDPNRPFYQEIARYSPIEIFELVAPPTIPPNVEVYMVNGNNLNRNVQVSNYLKNLTGKIISVLSANRDIRLNQIEKQRTIITNWGKQMFIVWSPVYRYNRNENLNRYHTFDRPDQDGVPGVTVYTWGY